MNEDEREELKKKVLIYVVRSRLPVTSNQVSAALDIVYPTALGMLFELALEGHLELVNKGWARYFRPVPVIREGLEVVRR